MSKAATSQFFRSTKRGEQENLLGTKASKLGAAGEVGAGIGSLALHQLLDFLFPGGGKMMKFLSTPFGKATTAAVGSKVGGDIGRAFHAGSLTPYEELLEGPYLQNEKREIAEKIRGDAITSALESGVSAGGKKLFTDPFDVPGDYSDSLGERAIEDPDYDVRDIIDSIHPDKIFSKKKDDLVLSGNPLTEPEGLEFFANLWSSPYERGKEFENMSFDEILRRSRGEQNV